MRFLAKVILPSLLFGALVAGCGGGGASGLKSDDVAPRVRQILAKQLKRNVGDIRDDSNCVRDFNADDLDREEVRLAIEEEFKLDISDEEFQRLWTSPVKALISYVADHVKGKK